MMTENTQNQENRGGDQGSGPGDKGNQSRKGNTSNRGFASMDPELQREIASKGGQAAHKQGVAHEWTSEEARAAGRKGGQASGSGRRNRNTGTSNAETNQENLNPESTSPGGINETNR